MRGRGAAVLAVAWLTAGCSVFLPVSDSPSGAPSTTEPGTSAPSTTAPSTSSPSTTTPSTSAPSPSAAPSSAAVRKVDLGIVDDGRSQHTEVSGPADLRVRYSAAISLVIQLDCRSCRGGVIVTEPGRGTPLGAVNAPFRAAYLIVPSTEGRNTETIQVRAAGRWKLTALSWNDLPAKTGYRSGTGSDVLFLADRAGRLRVDCTPKTTEECHVRVFNTERDSRLIGDDTHVKETLVIDLPGVVSISTNGRWSLRPLN